jgi:hypothetical protein
VKSGVEQILNRIGNELDMSIKLLLFSLINQVFFFFLLVVFVYRAEVDRCYGYRLIWQCRYGPIDLYCRDIVSGRGAGSS